MHQRFAPQPLPGEDYTAFDMREVAATGWSVHARNTVLAPVAEVLARMKPTVGVIESVDDATSVPVSGRGQPRGAGGTTAACWDSSSASTARARSSTTCGSLGGRYARAVAT